MTGKYFDLEGHLEKEHKVSPLATYLREIVYGGNDGIVTTFAVVAGFAGAEASNMATIPLVSVLLFGFANLFADGTSMALGNLLSSKSDMDVYKMHAKKEKGEIKQHPQNEWNETVELLTRKGFTEKQSKTLADIYRTNPKYWLEFMMKDELEMPDPTGDNPYIMALATFISFLSFGFIPLMPYLVFRGSEDVFLISSLATATALFFLGVLRWAVSKQSFVRSVTETLVLGGTAALVAYKVGTFFKA